MVDVTAFHCAGTSFIHGIGHAPREGLAKSVFFERHPRIGSYPGITRAAQQIRRECDVLHRELADMRSEFLGPRLEPIEEGERVQKIRPNHDVITFSDYAGGAKPLPLHEALLQLFGDLFPTVTSAKRACRKGIILVDGKRATTTLLLKGGERVYVLERVRGGDPLPPTQAPEVLDVVYEDEDLACVVKPQGMPMEGGKEGVNFRRCLMYCLKPSSRPGVLFRPQYCHRLDAETGGLVLVAKTRPALQALAFAFAHREVKKQYVAVVQGKLRGRGFIHDTIDGKPAMTEWLAGSLGRTQDGFVTQVFLFPHTGRYHQIRRHLASIGHPILGDRRYTHGYANLRRAKREADRAAGDLGGEPLQESSWAEAMLEPDSDHDDEGANHCDDSVDDHDDGPATAEKGPPDETTNSATVVRRRFGRDVSPDKATQTLSASTAVERLRYDLRKQRSALKLPSIEWKPGPLKQPDLLLKPDPASLSAIQDAWGERPPPLLAAPSRPSRGASSPRFSQWILEGSISTPSACGQLSCPFIHPLTLQVLTISTSQPSWLRPFNRGR
eukprot:jgi/Botrbrau1/4008/Bobra.0016s0018.1